jgi:hypothetical protein
MEVRPQAHARLRFPPSRERSYSPRRRLRQTSSSTLSARSESCQCGVGATSRAFGDGVARLPLNRDESGALHGHDARVRSLRRADGVASRRRVRGGSEESRARSDRSPHTLGGKVLSAAGGWGG